LLWSLVYLPLPASHPWCWPWLPNPPPPTCLPACKSL
jgi:hypothetical protein